MFLSLLFGYREDQYTHSATRGSEGSTTTGSAATVEFQRVLAHKLTNTSVTTTIAGNNVTSVNASNSSEYNNNNNNNKNNGSYSAYNQPSSGTVSNSNSRNHSHSQSHTQSVEEELHRLGFSGFIVNGGGVDHDSVKISMENTNTCTDSLVTAIDDEAYLLSEYLPYDNASFSSIMNYRGGSGKVHFGGDDLSLYGTPKEELGPVGSMSNYNGAPGDVSSYDNGFSRSRPPNRSNSGAGSGGTGEIGKQSFIKNQLQALFQPTDNKLAMKLFGSKKALMKERIRQKETGHWVIHPCSSFR